MKSGGRADAPSDIGKGARVWSADIISNLLQPLQASGEAVDTNFASPANLDADLSYQFLNEGADFLDELAKTDAAFVGVATPWGENPTFHYRVNQNYISLQFDIGVDSRIQARLNFANNAPQQLQSGKY